MIIVNVTDEVTFIKENNNKKVVKNFSINISFSQNMDKDMNVKEFVESRKKSWIQIKRF